MGIAHSDGEGQRDRLEWWKTGVVYQIYPRSFADGSGDGVGDLPGIGAHLDHVLRLGADALWLSPFYRSPMADFGYDVEDHCDVDPLFGDLDDADRLIAQVHERGMRLLVDYVPNHVSDRHPWFVAARSARDDPHRDWFLWRDPHPDGTLPNNWTAGFPFGAPCWTLDEATGQCYLHLFLPEQPDLDWNHPGVVDAMHDVLRFWLDRGVDGVRADVVHCIGKDPVLADLPDELAGLPALLQDFGPGTHEQLRALRRVLDEYPGDRVMVGETYTLSPEQMATYHGVGDELQLTFNFSALHSPWEADRWRGEIEQVQRLLDPIGAWPTWALSNHDVPRHRTRYGSDARARAAAVLLLTLRGTPFLYMGEELGLADADVPDERAVDPGGRDGCRAPLPWDATAGHGWPAEPWLPWPPAAGEHSVEAQSGDPASMLEHYRRLLALRRSHPALHRGSMELLDSPEGVLRWRRSWGDDTVEVAVNFSQEAIGGAVSAGHVAGGTHPPVAGAADATTPGVLEPDEARIVVVV